MQRLKLVGLLAFLVVGLSLAFFFVVRNDFGQRIRRGLSEDLAKTQMHFRALRFAHGKRLLQVAAWLAHNPELNFAKSIKEADETSRHREVFAAIEAIRPVLQKTDRVEYRPETVLVTDTTGKLVARNREVAQWGQTLDYPLLARVLTERVRDKDVWKFREQNERMMTVVAAPILDGAQPVGVLSLLYEHNNQMALDDRKIFTREEHFHPEVAYFLDDQIYGSTLTGPAQVEQLRQFLRARVAALREGKVVGPEALEVGGRKYQAIAAPFDDNANNRSSGCLLLASEDTALAPVSAFLGRLPFIAAGFLLVSIILGLLILRSVTSSYDRVEQGVSEVVSGNTEYKFDPQLPSGAGSLSHALNLLVAQLLGRPPPDREPEDLTWADPFFIEMLPPDEVRSHGYHPVTDHRSDLDSGLGLTLAYYEKLFRDYLEARRQAGEKVVENITFEQFVEKVRKNEDALRQKYSCPVVKFEVRTKEGKVTLKPIPIK
jgi:hypothetical protein